MAQGHRSGIAGELEVVVQPVVGEVGPAEPLQVHGEEGHVVEAVEVAELVVELQAVQGARAVVEAEDVVGDQVAVAVDDPRVGAPVGEQRAAAGQEPGGQPVDRVDHLPREHRARCPHLLDVRRPPAAERVAAPLRGHVGAAAGGGVEGGERPRQVPQVVPDRGAGPDQGRQAAVVGHAPHHDQMLDGRAVGAPAGPRRQLGTGDAADPEVDVGGEPPVELHLAAAGRKPALGSAEVEEGGRHRLLQLVGALTEQEHDPAVGLPHLGPTGSAHHSSARSCGRRPDDRTNSATAADMTTLPPRRRGCEPRIPGSRPVSASDRSIRVRPGPTRDPSRRRCGGRASVADPARPSRGRGTP